MDDTRRLDRADRFSLYLSAALAAVVIAATGWATLDRLSEVAAADGIPVLVPLSGETAELPLGPDGALVSVDVDTATVVVNDPAPATAFALWAEPIFGFVAVVVGMVIAATFFMRIARGRAFDRGTIRLVIAGAITVATAWLVGSILTNMTTNGALSAISDYTYDSVIFTTDLMPGVWILVLGAVAGALQLGEKLRRDTEGLV